MEPDNNQSPELFPSTPESVAEANETLEPLRAAGRIRDPFPTPSLPPRRHSLRAASRRAEMVIHEGYDPKDRDFSGPPRGPRGAW